MHRQSGTRALPRRQQVRDQRTRAYRMACARPGGLALCVGSGPRRRRRLRGAFLDESIRGRERGATIRGDVCWGELVRRAEERERREQLAVRQ